MRVHHRRRGRGTTVRAAAYRITRRTVVHNGNTASSPCWSVTTTRGGKGWRDRHHRGRCRVWTVSFSRVLTPQPVHNTLCQLLHLAGCHVCRDGSAFRVGEEVGRVGGGRGVALAQRGSSGNNVIGKWVLIGRVAQPHRFIVQKLTQFERGMACVQSSHTSCIAGVGESSSRCHRGGSQRGRCVRGGHTTRKHRRS